MFIKKVVKMFGELTILTTDKTPPFLCTFKKLKRKGFYVYMKRCFAKSLGFQTFLHASHTIK